MCGTPARRCRSGTAGSGRHAAARAPAVLGEVLLRGGRRGTRVSSRSGLGQPFAFGSGPPPRSTAAPWPRARRPPARSARPHGRRRWRGITHSTVSSTAPSAAYTKVVRGRASPKRRAARTGSSTHRLVSAESAMVASRIEIRSSRGQRVVGDVGQQDDQRPVPQVDRVGDVAEERRRPQHQQPGARPAERGRLHPDQRRRGAPPRSRRCRASGSARRRPGSTPAARPARPSRALPGRRAALRGSGGREGQQGARAELPGPGRGDEVGPRRVGRGHPERVGQRREVADAPAPRRPPPPRGAEPAARRHRLAQPDPEQHQQRPDQVELLLGRQRPVVLGRRGRVVGGEVVDRVRPRAPSSRRTARPPRISPKNCCHTSRGTNTSTPTAETSSTTYDAGSSRRIRRAQNCDRLTDPVRSTSRRRCEVIRKPEITKKTSTPM